jgi:hypothetical protein
VVFYVPFAQVRRSLLRPMWVSPAERGPTEAGDCAIHPHYRYVSIPRHAASRSKRRTTCYRWLPRHVFVSVPAPFCILVSVPALLLSGLPRIQGREVIPRRPASPQPGRKQAAHRTAGPPDAGPARPRHRTGAIRGLLQRKPARGRDRAPLASTEYRHYAIHPAYRYVPIPQRVASPSRRCTTFDNGGVQPQVQEQIPGWGIEGRRRPSSGVLSGAICPKGHPISEAAARAPWYRRQNVRI